MHEPGAFDPEEFDREVRRLRSEAEKRIRQREYAAQTSRRLAAN